MALSTFSVRSIFFNHLVQQTTSIVYILEYFTDSFVECMKDEKGHKYKQAGKVGRENPQPLNSHL